MKNSPLKAIKKIHARLTKTQKERDRDFLQEYMKANPGWTTITQFQKDYEAAFGCNPLDQQRKS